LALAFAIREVGENDRVGEVARDVRASITEIIDGATET
jgi:hypothetical protein